MILIKIYSNKEKKKEEERDLQDFYLAATQIYKAVAQS